MRLYNDVRKTATHKIPFPAVLSTLSKASLLVNSATIMFVIAPKAKALAHRFSNPSKMLTALKN